MAGDRPEHPAHPGAPGVEQAALRFLRRRPRTEAEMRNHLIASGHRAEEIERLIERLRECGHLNDRSLAVHFLSARAGRLARGRNRLLHELARRGVDAQVARAAWDEAVADGLVEPRAVLARAVARRARAAGGRLDSMAAMRVYNALLREGFDPEETRAALVPYSDATDRLAEDLADEAHDDLP